MSLIFPFKTMLDLNNGALEPNGHTTKRYLQDMLTAYTDSEAVTQIHRARNPVRGASR